MLREKSFNYSRYSVDKPTLILDEYNNKSWYNKIWYLSAQITYEEFSRFCLMQLCKPCNVDKPTINYEPYRLSCIKCHEKYSLFLIYIENVLSIEIASEMQRFLHPEGYLLRMLDRDKMFSAHYYSTICCSKECYILKYLSKVEIYMENYKFLTRVKSGQKFLKKKFQYADDELCMLAVSLDPKVLRMTRTKGEDCIPVVKQTLELCLIACKQDCTLTDCIQNKRLRETCCNILKSTTCQKCLFHERKLL
jgi:hypothetical protein